MPTETSAGSAEKLKCFRCGGLFESYQGKMADPRLNRTIGSAMVFGRLFLGAKPQTAFMCNTCRTRRRRIMLIAYGVFVIAFAVALKMLWSRVSQL